MAPHLAEVGYRVDDLTIDVRRQRVARGNEEITLSPLSYELLLALSRAAPDLVSQHELMEKVWPGLVVSPEAVSQRVKLVRRALGDNAVSPRYIAGVRGRGYRVIAPVEAIDSADAPHPGASAIAAASTGAPPLSAANPAQVREPSVSRHPARARRLPRRVLYAVLGLLAAAAGYRYAGQSLRDPPTAQPPAAATEVTGNSLAVLPFIDLSRDADSEHFSDGLSEEILNRLSRSPDLRVLARTSSFAYKDSGLDARKLKARLGVKYLLEGSVRREGRHLRVTAQLVDESGFRMWSNSYDREITDIFAIQDEIATAVATSILPQVAVVPEEKSRPDVEAYAHYLIGREILRKRLRDSRARAQRELQHAVELDPDFAEARAELAIALALDPGDAQDAELLDRARAEVDAALALRPDLARAHAAAGLLLLSRHVLQMQPLEGARIEAALRRALELDPNMVDAHNWLANAFAEQGRYEDARAEWQRGVRVAPLAPAVNANLAADSASQGDYRAAERRLQRLLESPQSFFAWLGLENLYSSTGQLARANAIARRLAWDGVEDGNVSNELLVTSYARLGMWEAAWYWNDRLEREQGRTAGARSDLLRRQGRYADAAATAEATLGSKGVRSAGARGILNLGTLRALAGDHAAAIELLEPASLADFTPADFAIDAGHALAWAYASSGAPERARPILAGLERFFAGLGGANRLHGSGMLYLLAQNALLAGEPGLAIDRLRRAVGAGWRDYHRLRHDPRWQPLRRDARLQALMATVAADVERQRLQVERGGGDDDFVARIDAAVAARHGPD